MNKKVFTFMIAILLAICTRTAGFYAGKVAGQGAPQGELQVEQQEELQGEPPEELQVEPPEEQQGELQGEQQIALERLQELNRAGIENVIIEKEPIYVIGHKSPDSDTVCSAIAYARLLTALGYPAEPRITMPVNHESAYILKESGTEVPPILENAAGCSIFLVDHSEYMQAAEGMKDAHIVGILDHHGVGSVSTGHQVIYNAKPIGATATIVWLDYLNYGVEIDRETAFLLLGAVLSDTNNLTGTTVTGADRAAVEELAPLAGVTDVDALYKKLHEMMLSYEGMSSEEIFFSDYKEYEAGGIRYGIGILNAIDDETAMKLAEQMKEALPDCFSQKNVDLMYASVGIRENGEKIDRIVPANERSEEVFKKAFPSYDEFDGTSFLFRTGLGRKTLFVPGMTDYLNSNPQ